MARARVPCARLAQGRLQGACNAGCTGPEIMAVSGHSSLAQVQVYIDER